MEKLKNSEIFILLWIQGMLKREKPNMKNGICYRLSMLEDLGILSHVERKEFSNSLKEFVINVRDKHNSDFKDLLILQNIEIPSTFWFKDHHDRQLFLQRLINLEYMRKDVNVSNRFVFSVIILYYFYNFENISKKVKGFCDIFEEINRLTYLISVRLYSAQMLDILSNLSRLECLQLGLYQFAIYRHRLGYVCTSGDHKTRIRVTKYMLKNKERIFKIQ